MGKQKHFNYNDFLKQSTQEKINTLKALTKRANVRLKYMEDIGLTNDRVYQETKIVNEDNGRFNNRFYQGGKYKDEKEIDQAFKNVNKFLESNGSTISGITKDIKSNISKQLELDGKISVDYIESLSNKEKRIVNNVVSDIANERLKDLREKDINSKARALAEQFNKENGMKTKRFSKRKKMSKNDLEKNIQEAISFINSRGSMANKVIETRNKTIETFRSKGVKISDENIDTFFDFLASERFSKMKKYMGSEQIVETFTNALDNKEEVDNINKAFDEYQNGEMTYDELQEILNIAPWQ